MSVSLSRKDLAVVAGLLVLTAVAYGRSLFLYFLSDDFVLLHHVAAGPHSSWRPWFTTAGGDGFFRPLGYLSLALTSVWAGTDAVLWHAAALFLHFLNSVLVYMLAIVWGRSQAAAAFASAVFVIHGTRPEAVIWIAGRFDLLATFFVLCGLLLFLRSQTLAAVACMAAAMLTKESAYVFPLLLAVVPQARDRRFWKRWTLFGAVAFAVFAYRWSLFGGIGGYRDIHSGGPQVFTMGVVKALEAAVLRIWAVLWFPINWSREPSTLLAALAAVYLCATARLAASASDRLEALRAMGFVLVSILPPLHLLLIGADLAKSRLLYLPSVGFCLLLAVAFDGVRHRMRYAAAGAMVVFHFTALQHNLDAWEYASGKARSASQAAAQCASYDAQGLPGSLRGVPFFANGFPEAVALQQRTRIAARQGPCRIAWDRAADELRVTAADQ